MSADHRQRIESNHRVVVEPRSLGDFGFARVGDQLVESDPIRRAQKYRESCEEIADDLRRLVRGVGHIYIDCDADYSCRHCGAVWTEGADSPHNGGCCDHDIGVMDSLNIATDD